MSTFEMKMPKLGLDIEEATILKWWVNEGDRVEEGEVILEVETDKVTMEVEAPASGLINRLLYGPGEVVKVLETIALISEGEGAALVTRASDPVRATPKARRLSKQMGIDLYSIQPAAGRVITACDVQNVKKALDHPADEGNSRKIQRLQTPSPGNKPTQVNQQAAGKGERRFQIIEKIKLSGIRRSIAQKMMRSHAQIPAFSVSAKVDFSQVEQMITAIRQERHLRITYTDFILRATALALEKVKQLNALFSMEEEAILIPNQINLGLAVQAERGLVVPTISQANKKSIYQLCAERRRLLESVRNNRIQRGDLEQSTFTISNMGMYSVDQFTAMINPPQVGILAVGSAQQEWRVNNGQIEEWRSVTLTLTADHRVVDGHDAALFLDEVKKRLEQPVLMLLTEADTE